MNKTEKAIKDRNPKEKPKEILKLKSEVIEMKKSLKQAGRQN